MNVLFLHGCRQNSEIYMQIMSNYIKMISKLAPGSKFYGLDGPFQYNGELENHLNQKGLSAVNLGESSRMWYETVLRIESIGFDNTPHEHIIFTLDYLEMKIELHDIDILIGFSQGANLVDTYVRLRNLNSKIKKVIIFNGYTFPRYETLLPNVQKGIIVTSQSDEIVPPHTLCNNYLNSSYFEHEKGHKIKTNNSFIRTVVQSLISE